MKKLWLKIRIFFVYLFQGLYNADKIAFSAQKDGLDSLVGGIEQEVEKNSVYKDLLRGELTQEVIELRHEMYFTERESHKYVYAGNGTVKKMNNIFDIPSTSIEQSDGNKIILIQPNKEDPESLSAYNLDNNTADYMKTIKWDFGTKTKRHFNICIERDFLPRYAIERYATQLVLKESPVNGKNVIDIYIPKYRKQFDNIQKMFLKEMEKIYMGETRTEILDFKAIWFITNNAYGVDNSIYYEFDNILFDNIIEFDGNYIFRFVVNCVESKDLLDTIYDSMTAKKFEEHAPRENRNYDITIDLVKEGKEDYNITEAQGLLNELNNG